MLVLRGAPYRRRYAPMEIDLERFILKHGEKSFCIFMFLGIIPSFFYETVLNESYIWAFKHLSAPILTICFYIYFKRVPNWRRDKGDFKGILWTLAIASMLILTSGGYTLGFNSLVGKQSEYAMKGIITKLDTRHSTKGSTSYYIYLNLEGSSEVLKLDVSKFNYESSNVGDFYAEKWKKGSLGFLYKRI